jgi:hypothetical protein
MIEINKSVYEEMYMEFSKRSVDKALAGYADVLSNLIHKSISNDYALTDIGQYQIPMKELVTAGGKITDSKGKQVRVHTWLKDNKPIIQVLKLGNSLQKVNSTISLINCTYTDIFDMKKEKDQEVQLDEMLDNEQYDAIFFREYPDSIEVGRGRGKVSKQEWMSRFDIVEVNEVTLKNYLNWLMTESTKIDADKKKSYIRKARTILAISQITGGKWYQRKNPSEFGRMYYSGLSMHNIPKAMRKNVLGDSWQYDISSSAIAWKLSYAAAYNRDVKSERFQYTNHYLTDKEDFIQDCLNHVFLNRKYTENGNVKCNDIEWSRSKIKEMLNAISFGAKTFGIVIPNPKNPSKPLTNSLGDILKDNDLRNAFLNHDLISGFIYEHNELADYILSKYAAEMKGLSCVKSEKGRRSKAKEMAYLYQHAETKMMDRVREMVSSFGHAVLVSVHDAIIVRNKIDFDDLHEIEMTIQEEFGMPYWKLVGERMQGYHGLVGTESDSVDRDVAIHKLIIQLQERVLVEGIDYRVTESDLTEESIQMMMDQLKADRRTPKRSFNTSGKDFYNGSGDYKIDLDELEEIDE